MKKYDSSEMFFTKGEILRFWQEEFVPLDENCSEEFLGSIEIAELLKLIKPAVYLGFIEKLKMITSREVLVQRKVWSKTKDVWRNGTDTWIVDDSISSIVDDSMSSAWGPGYSFQRGEELLPEWEKIYGILDTTMKRKFLKKSVIHSITRYKKSIVIAELVNHKKLDELFAKLQSLEFEEQAVWNSQIKVSTRFDWTSQIDLAKDYFVALNTKFEKEINLKPLPRRNIVYGAQDSLNTCNSCGMIIGLLNSHEC